ncbi:P-loop containing nucleoside triphosphate hydrolase protein [Lentinula edodes]|nr:P-loop containing nucleoside triphosphate hydrolase protein [Lentinula edodes]
MPLLIDKHKQVIIISPLNALEEDQASRFKEMGLSVIAVNGDTWNSQAHKDITDGKYNVIITSPDMALKHEAFCSIISNSTFAHQTLAIIVDKLGTLRAYVPAKVPFLAASATLPSAVLAQVRHILHMNALESFHVNLGTDCPNIVWFMHHMKAGKSDLDLLNFVLWDDLATDEISQLMQTMVFFDDISVALDALKHLSDQSLRSKRRVMQEFRDGEIKILLTTEVAGMGCDLPHVQHVVQFMVPKSLSIWLQCAGRAVRDRCLSGEVFLLVQPTVFQEQKKKKGSNEDDCATYRKDVEAGLCLWIETHDCRCEVLAEYFSNGVAQSDSTVPPPQPCSPASDVEDSPSSEVHGNGKHHMAPATPVSN